MYIKKILSIATLLFVATINAQVQPYKIFTSEGKEVSFEKMNKSLQKADVVLFGELHNNTIAHYLQVKVAKSLHTNQSKKLIIGAEMFERDQAEILKNYVEGKLDESGTIRLPIIKSEDGIRRTVDENGQECVTHYRTIKSNERASFVELELETGRTHQIRVHMSAIGHPIFGDELYGGNMDFIERQALHCIELGFYSPRLEKEIRVKTKLHDDITELLMKLGLN